MKKHLLVLSGLLVGGIAVAQHTPVPQTVQKRVAILEELTGINCQYCPDGHKRANEIAANNPGKVVLVNIHAGSFAPTSGTYNFTTSAGNSINTFLNPTGYPAGGVQRNPHSSDMSRIATGRGNWASQVNAVINQDSEVNVAMEASIDASTREVTVTVELFYPTPMAGTTHYLNVGILQNNIQSPHVAMNTNPAQVLPNGMYNNLHMFRGFVNSGGVWGDAVDASSPNVITKTYTYTLPATVGNTPLELGNLEFFAFVHKGHNTPTTSQVLSAAKIEPSYINVPAATVSMNSILNDFNAECNTNGSLSPIVSVKNIGDAVSSVEFSYSVNGGPASTYTYNTAIPAFGSANVTLPAINYTVGGSNSVTVQIISVNNGAGTIGATPSLTKNIAAAAVIQASNGNEITININTDNYPGETTWALKNESNVTIASGGPYQGAANGAAGGPDALKKKSHKVIIPADGCYSLTLSDGYGDGLSYGTNPNGGVGFSIDYNGSTIYSRLQPSWDFGSGVTINGSLKAEGGFSPTAIPSQFTGCSQSNVNAGSTITFGPSYANAGVNFSWEVTPNTGVSFVNNTSNTSKNPQIKFTYGGNYTVTLTTSSQTGTDETETQNCVKVVGSYLNIDEFDFNAGISIYPNPADNILNASVNLENNSMVNFRVVNAQGQTVLIENIAMNAGINIQSLDIANLAAGIYTLQITADGQVSSKPFVKK